MDDLGGTGVRLRQLNLELLRAALRETPQGAAKRTLSRKTGLSQATCGTLLAQLVENGEAVELAREESGGGRPALLYGCNRELAVSALLHRDGESGILTGGVANTAGEILFRETVGRGEIDAETAANVLTGLAERFPRIRAGAVSFPGPVPGGLAEALQKRLAFPVVADREMNFAAAGYVEFSAALRCGTVCLVHFPVGRFPRAGIAVDGRVLRGRSGFAGEVSFLPFGISREQQAMRLGNRAGLIGQVAETVAALTAVLNPLQVALSGREIDESMRPPLRRLCGKAVPPEQLPELIFRSDCFEDCLRGMAVAAMGALAPAVRLVER